MFEATQTRSRWPLWIALAVVGAGLGGAAWLGLDGLDLLLGGGNPLASPVAENRVEQPYPQSPLALALDLEANVVEVDRDGVLAWADALAEQLGTWMLAETGARDVHLAEAQLWADDRFDLFVAKFAVALQDRGVYSRNDSRLSAGVDRRPLTVHADDLALLFAHVAWRLDLDSTLMRSPVHLYSVARQPGGERARAVEATCFQCVDSLGHARQTDEPSVGRRLLHAPENYPKGVVGIRDPDPLPPGAYQAVTAEALPGDLAARLVARHGVEVVGALRAHLTDSPAAAQALFQLHLAEGLAAHEAGNVDALQAAADALLALRRDHGELLPAAPAEQGVAAAAAFAAGGDGEPHLRPALTWYDAKGPVEQVTDDAHALVLWLALERRAVDHSAWNARIIPLMNHHRGDPDRFAALCRLGDQALRGVEETLEELMPDCTKGP